MMQDEEVEDERVPGWTIYLSQEGSDWHADAYTLVSEGGGYVVTLERDTDSLVRALGATKQEAIERVVAKILERQR